MDDELRRLGRAARAEVETGIDVDAGLAAVESSPTPNVVAIAAAVAAIVGGIVLLDDSDSIESVDPADSTTAMTTVTTTVTTTSVPADVPVSDPTVTTTTSDAAVVTPSTTTASPATTTTTAAPAPGGDVIAVDSDTPPPPLDLAPLGSVEIDSTSLPDVAIGELGVAVNQSADGTVTVLGFDGGRRTIDLDEEAIGVSRIVYGPGDVLYGLRQIGPPFDFEMVAVPLSGDRAGTVVARSEALGATTWVELPPSPFGHGLEGVVARTREVGTQLIGYVDVNGEPTILSGTIPHFPTITDDLVVETENFGAWALSINGRRSAQDSFTGAAVPAPTTGNRTVYATHFGPVGADVLPAVMAILEADGTGRWATIPDGYDYLASDSPGTVFGRIDGTTLDVALLAGDTVNWRSLDWENSGVPAPCADCTQLLVGADGTPVTYDPDSRHLIRHTIPAVETTLPSAYVDAFLYHLGPDDVVYLGVASPTEGEVTEIDIAAVTLSASDAGRELARWEALDSYVGDAELVVTRDGLVDVGCCGPDAERPAPDAPVLAPWLGSNGAPTAVDGPVIRVEIDYPDLTVHRDDDLPVGTRSWTFEPGHGWMPRGMPKVMPTFDGGFVAWTFGDTTTVIRGWTDGSIDTVELDDSLPFISTLDPSGRFLMRTDNRFARVEPFGDRTEFWAGFADHREDGSVTLPDIDVPIDLGAAWSRDPVAFGNAVAGRVAANETRTVDLERRDQSVFVVTVTTSNFFDDSVFASRLELELQRDGDGTFRFVSGRWAQACQPDRGHQDFTAEPCT